MAQSSKYSAEQIQVLEGLEPAKSSFPHRNGSGNVNFVKELLQAEQWQKHNVNIRAILEYLMLKMPGLDSE